MHPNKPLACATLTEAMGDALLSPLLQAAVQPPTGHGTSAAAMSGVVVGELVALAGAGASALVHFPGAPDAQAQQARSCVDLQDQHVGASVVLVFEHGDLRRPVVMGVLRAPQHTGSPAVPAPVELEHDGQRVLIRAHEQMVLRCGQASITLTRAGKVLIEGSYVSSRSTGMQRIKGAAVQLN